MKGYKKSILGRIRESRSFKAFSICTTSLFVFQILTPSLSYALTSGPSQPEFSSFEAASNSNMVDLYSGDFTYNIPLLSVPGPQGGYPINMAYHSGVTMEKEASWVGLGWSLNMGSINRQVRGLPDDFKGEKITQKFHTKPSWSVSADIPISSISGDETHAEFAGIPYSTSGGASGISFNNTATLYYNNYKGLGYNIGTGISKKGVPLSVNVGFDSQNGIGVSPKLSLPFLHGAFGFTAGIAVNSRTGSSGLSFGSFSGITRSGTYEDKNGNDKEWSSSGQTSSAMGFASFSEAPQSSMPVSSKSFPFKVSIRKKDGLNGPLFYESDKWPWHFTGSFSTSKMINDGIVESSGYGYLHTPENTSDNDMLDLGRTNMPTSKKIPNLAPATYNHDLYNLTGQGTGGMFRPMRNDVSILHQKKSKSENKTYDLGAEAGAFNLPTSFHVGLDFVLDRGVTSSGDWKADSYDSSPEVIDDIKNGNNNTDGKEPYYFKMYGEHTGQLLNDEFLTKWGGDAAVKTALKKTDKWTTRRYYASDDFKYSTSGSNAFDVNGTPVVKERTERQRRSTYINQRTAEQAAQYGNSKYIQYYKTDSDGSGWQDERISEHKPTTTASYVEPNHLSEFEVIQPNGMRYYYGLPAYNHYQLDVSMSVNDNEDFNASTVDVNDNGHLSTDQQYLTQKELPPYVHSWLLTSTVSDDYIDKTGNGPSDDDYGYWTKFTYYKTTDNYRWRTPYEDGNFVEGKKGDAQDNTAYFSFGTKELFYMATVETKTHIAVFHTSDREDAIEAPKAYSNSGTVSSNIDKMKRLDKIELFSKREYYDASGNVNANAVPLQITNFVYTYELCPEVLNNTGNVVMLNEDGVTNGSENVNSKKGKLTLRKVYTTYERSNRGASSPYIFNYGNLDDDEQNASYASRNMDRWGSFKNNTGSVGNYKEANNGTANQYPYVDFPYTDQDDPNLGHYAGMWSLKKINLPTGGSIEIEYEKDDYAYVETKRATRMFDIVGVSGYNSNAGNRNQASIVIDNLNIENSTDDGYRVYFKLEEPIPDTKTNVQTNKIIAEEYVGDIKHLWFKAFCWLNPSILDVDRQKDYVTGYAELMREELDHSDYFGVMKSDVTLTDYDIGFVTLKKVPLQENRAGLIKANPIQKAAIQHLRMNRPELLDGPFNATANNGFSLASLGNVIASFGTAMNDISGMIAGYNVWAKDASCGQSIELNGRSIIKLQDPDAKKVGGGDRVKKVTYHDNWSGSGGKASYGLEYDYSKEENGRTISSGVAYEPFIGAEESALRGFIDYEESTPMRSPYAMYLETPLMEEYYPSAGVGYSKVTVKSTAPEELKGDDPSKTLFNSAAPFSISEFYTGRDFPVYFDQTDLDADPAIVRPLIIPGIYSSFRKEKAKSQGYAIVLNDMAGKSKKESSYTRKFDANGETIQGDLITRTEYKYRTQTNRPDRLDNHVQVLTSEGEYQTAVCGQTFDVFIDRHENRYDSEKLGVNLNLDFTPFPLLFLWPQLGENEQSLKTIVTNKIIHRAGIVEEVIVSTDQATIKTENLAYHIETGEALLNRTTNEFDDPIYNLSYPAHWYYNNMGGAYLNTGLYYDATTMSNIQLTQGVISGAGLDYTRFTRGDEISIGFSNSGSTSFQTLHVVEVFANQLRCVGEYGDGITIPNQLLSLTVKRSGRRNLLTAKAGALVARQLTNFIEDGNFIAPQTFQIDEVVDASAVEFKDQWNTNCLGCSLEGYFDDTEGTAQNPYLIGVLGNWKANKSYKYLTGRQYNNNAKEDGVYADFENFNWINPANSNPKWTWANRITKYSPYGYELENQDAVGRYSAALYGYRNSLTIAVGANMRYSEMFYEGFEDAPKACDENHIRWDDLLGGLDIKGAAHITNDQAHTGFYSMQVNGQSSISNTTTLKEGHCDADNPTIAYGELGEDFYTVGNCECIGTFQPIADKEYVFSTWVKVGNNLTDELPSYTNISAIITVDGVTTVLQPIGKVIEGWQRIYGKIEVPLAANNVSIELDNSGSLNAYFDDLRFHPLLGNMKSYVYNPVNLKLEAELDANNYATFYVYDAEGNLVLRKKETRDGVQTLSESRTATYRKTTP